MSSLNQIKLVLFTLSIFFTGSVNAQIQKGAITTESGLSAGYESKDLKKANGLGLSQSYGRFVSDKILLKADLHVSQYKSSSDLAYGQSMSVGITPEIRYYFNPTSKVQYFGGVSLNLAADILRAGEKTNDTKQFIRTQGQERLYLGGSLFVGMNRFLNKEISLQGMLTYRFTHTLYQSENKNNHDIGLTVNLANFINLSSEKESMQGLIDEGRTVIDGSLSLQKDGKGYIRAEYGKFVKKGLLLGIKTGGTSSVLGYIQYFHPISNRLMVHAKGELEYVFSNRLAISELAVGSTYFLSKNVALSLNLLSYSPSHSHTIRSNAGLVYFLK
jgi:hypothetical protein